MKCNLFHYLKTTFECAKRMNLRYVQEIGRLECNRTGFCGCLKYFEKEGYQVKVIEINKKVDLIKIDKKVD
jgi:hypothetical protein